MLLERADELGDGYVTAVAKHQLGNMEGNLALANDAGAAEVHRYCRSDNHFAQASGLKGQDGAEARTC